MKMGGCFSIKGGREEKRKEKGNGKKGNGEMVGVGWRWLEIWRWLVVGSSS